MVRGPHLTQQLLDQAIRTEAAARKAGLDFFEVVFEPLDARDVNAVAAYTGFPSRYSSWRFGMEFERLQKGYEYGLSKIYELVINNDPTVAYLVKSNSFMEQKLVMAHVFGHADFFKHNVWFGATDRRMHERMEQHAETVRRLMERHGQDQVEVFLDEALSLESMVDPYLPLREQLRNGGAAEPTGTGMAERARAAFEATMEDPSAPKRPTASPKRDMPTYDVLGFLLEHAPLPSWKRDLLHIVREEAYYFMPQRMTKIMNEGWASFWHSKLLTQGLLDTSEVVEFADCHSGATATRPGQLNPYKFGIELFRHAERKGMDIFRLRRVHNDVSFIDEVVDEEFAAESQLFLIKKNGRTGKSEVAGRNFQAVKSQLLRDLAWCGAPRVQLTAVTEEGCLELVHQHDGRDLKLDEAGQLLTQLSRLWGAPAHLLTLEEGQGRRMISDGETVKVLEARSAEEACADAEGAQPSDDGKRAG